MLRDEDRQVCVDDRLLGFAAQQHSGGSAAATRSYHKQIASLVFRNSQDRRGNGSALLDSPPDINIVNIERGDELIKSSLTILFNDSIERDGCRLLNMYGGAFL
jgi:hypothetical protein